MYFSNAQSGCLSAVETLQHCFTFGPLGSGPVFDLLHLARLVLLIRAERCQTQLLLLDVALPFCSYAACLVGIQSISESTVHYLRSYYPDSVTAVTLQKHSVRLFYSLPWVCDSCRLDEYNCRAV